MKCPNELAGMKANELGLERSTCVTPCLIAEDQGSSNESTPCLRPSQLNSRAICGVTSPEHEGELNYISKFLIQYVPTKKTVDTGKRATGA